MHLAPGARCSAGCRGSLTEPHTVLGTKPVNCSCDLLPFLAPAALLGTGRSPHLCTPGLSRPADPPLRPYGPSRQPEVSASLCPRADLQVPWPADITIIGWQDGLGEFNQ